MTDPRGREILITPSVRRWVGKDGRNGPPAFHDPFPPEMRQPVASLNRPARRLAFRFHQVNYTDCSGGLLPPNPMQNFWRVLAPPTPTKKRPLPRKGKGPPKSLCNVEC